MSRILLPISQSRRRYSKRVGSLPTMNRSRRRHSKSSRRQDARERQKIIWRYNYSRPATCSLLFLIPYLSSLRKRRSWSGLIYW
ncbi:hypothetical protein BT96DRAFT_562199 [Gymnopus androsaceus JB14]|uniref:Uncharacterized protein n=1 Tax=Gymnopus androsaceus JB14 TaxID=1447944 RepID=A0A6A4HYZ1_9AGAR|nr:hypothetical protein BT96DRAFT_562199 [Gymnopus androsaceus JB14]